MRHKPIENCGTTSCTNNSLVKFSDRSNNNSGIQYGDIRIFFPLGIFLDLGILGHFCLGY